MTKDEMIDDLISMLDGTMAEGAGHVNITVDENGNIEKDVKTMGCPDNSVNPMACQIPTIFLKGDDEFGL
ncbi:MAG: hypothetical protein E7254_12125 [Lachnospiraceae bacterium]|nr:hypothetical protein [Lachnospiraceae bacterium]